VVAPSSGDAQDEILMALPASEPGAPAASVFSCEVRDLHPRNPLLAALAAIRALQTVHSGSNRWAAVVRLRSGRRRPVAVFASDDRVDVAAFAARALADLERLSAVEFARTYVHRSVHMGVSPDGSAP
jgi:hypothetical protein